MTTVNDIYSCIDSFAPFQTAEEWDNVGVLVGDKNADVTKAVLALDITNGVLDEAHTLGAQLVISHHPVIFGGIKRVMADSPVYRAASYGLSCLCAHTNLDRSAVFGVNTALSDACGLKNCRESDLGEILFLADTERPLTAEELAVQIKTRLGAPGISYTAACGEIKTVALCSGGGGSEIFAAAKAGADALITGEIKHHELVWANDANISVFVLGHYVSEDVVLSPLADRLSQAFPEVEFVKSKVFTDGVKIV